MLSIPDFLVCADVLAIPHSLVYDGLPPARANLVVPMAPGHEYVYLMSDADDAPIYVGRSFRPADRFSRHRRRPWWPDVARVRILRVPEPELTARWIAGPRTARLEALAISRLNPAANVAAPLRKVS